MDIGKGKTFNKCKRKKFIEKDLSCEMYQNRNPEFEFVCALTMKDNNK